MALAPKPVVLTSGSNPNPAVAPEPLIVVGSIPGAGVTSVNGDTGDVVLTVTDIGITPQTAPTIDPAPADATAVASDLQDLVDALVLAGVLTVDPGTTP